MLGNEQPWLQKKLCLATPKFQWLQVLIATLLFATTGNEYDLVATTNFRNQTELIATFFHRCARIGS
jgi:hypothetical protein